MRSGLVLCAAVLGVAGVGPDSVAGRDGAEVVRTVVRRQGDDGVHTYRIPGLAATPKGTLVAAFDVRHKNAADLPGDIDVGVMRSTDGGRTWGKMQRVLDFDAALPDSRGNGVGDPAVLVDRKRGRVVVAGLWSKGNRAWNGSGPGLTPEETGQVVLTRSDDDGLTWSPPVNVTAKLAGRGKDWKLLFQGPGGGIQLADGTLVFAAQYRDAAGTPHSCFISSTDGGDTWAVSAPAIPTRPPTSEAQVAQLADGSLLLTMRDESRGGKRAWARYEWAGDVTKGKWGEPWFAVPDPTCMGSLVRHPAGPLLLASPGSPKERKALTARTSSDGGKTWGDGRVLDPRPCAYSCLALLADGRVGVLYECGDRAAYETLTFASFPLAWVTGR